jgi:hypothetical protein
MIELGTNNLPILITLTLSGTGVPSLTTGDLTVAIADALGTNDTWVGGDYVLTEVGATFPGRYVITDYPVIDNPTTYLSKLAGTALLSISGALFDNQIKEVEVSEIASQTRSIHRRANERLEWDADESRWDLYDENDVKIGHFDALDVNGNPAVIDGTHPVTRLAFVAV